MSKKKIILRIIVFIFSIAIGVFAGLYYAGYYLTISIPPENPIYPTDEDDYNGLVIQDAKISATEDDFMVTYLDGISENAHRCNKKETRFLNRNLKKAEITWINLHTGYCIVDYKIIKGNTLYEYYQHVNSTEYLYVRTSKLDKTNNTVSQNSKEE